MATFGVLALILMRFFDDVSLRDIKTFALTDFMAAGSEIGGVQVEGLKIISYLPFFTYFTALMGFSSFFDKIDVYTGGVGG